MVLVHVCFINNTAIFFFFFFFFFHFDEIGENQGQKQEHWQNHNNSNGKLALKHIVPFPTENDHLKNPLPMFPDNDWFSTCFSQADLTNREIYIVIFHLSSCMVYAENFKNISAYTKIYLSVYRATSFGKWKVNSEGEK